MLRKLPTSESELVTLCRAKRWSAVCVRAHSHPSEAVPSDASLRGEGSTVLGLALRLGAPVDVLRALHRAHPYQIGLAHKGRGSLLHDSFRYRVSDSVLLFVLECAGQFQQHIQQQQQHHHHHSPSSSASSSPSQSPVSSPRRSPPPLAASLLARRYSPPTSSSASSSTTPSLLASLAPIHTTTLTTAAPTTAAPSEVDATATTTATAARRPPRIQRRTGSSSGNSDVTVPPPWEKGSTTTTPPPTTTATTVTTTNQSSASCSSSTTTPRSLSPAVATNPKTRRTAGGTPPPGCFQHIHVQDNMRLIQSPNLFLATDDCGRTVLHHLVEALPHYIAADHAAAAAAIPTTAPSASSQPPPAAGTATTPTRPTHSLAVVRQVLRDLLEWCPELAGIPDSDGNTPLVVLVGLSIPQQGTTGPTTPPAATNPVPLPVVETWRNTNTGSRGISFSGNSMSIQQRLEAEITTVAQLLVTLAPDKALRARKLPRPWRFLSMAGPPALVPRSTTTTSVTAVTAPPATATTPTAAHARTSTTTNRVPTLPSSSLSPPPPSTTSPTTTANAPTCPPLYYAVLNDRSLATIDVLLQASQRRHHTNAGAALVTQYREHSLHVAVTRRIHPATVERLLQEYPPAVLAPDVFGLTPVDWIWMVHVKDVCAAAAAVPPAPPTTVRGVVRDGGGGAASAAAGENGAVGAVATRLPTLPIPLHHTRASRRRYLHREFRLWHDFVTRHYQEELKKREDQTLPLRKARSHRKVVLDASSIQTRLISVGRRQEEHRSQEGQQQQQQHAANALGNLTLSPLVAPSLRNFQFDFLERMNVLLPAAAALHMASMRSSSSLPPNSETLHMDVLPNRPNHQFLSTASDFRLLHAACFLPSCCLGMLRIVCLLHPGATQELMTPDDAAGRYPLHYAATRVCGYRANWPVGAALVRGVRELREPSPVLDMIQLYPTACRIRDRFECQLPLHIAIGAAKQERVVASRRHQQQHVQQFLPDAIFQRELRFIESEEERVLEALLFYYPESLGRRDGATRLFPWQQAAVGRGASLNTIYRLLRREPTHFHLPAASLR